MRGRANVFGAMLAGVIGLVSAASPAGAASLFELNFWMSGPRYDAIVPLCNDPGVFGYIRDRFSAKEGIYWNSDLTIVGFERVRETAWRPWAAQTIPRRYCSGVALVTDGKRHTIHYSVVETSGWIGVGWGVEWCVVGLDRNWAYNPACRAARP